MLVGANFPFLCRRLAGAAPCGSGGSGGRERGGEVLIVAQ